ncbi:MAG: DNA double-strand break repair nuclease NurA [Candidatus Hodarchaeales archaeon]|jgi:hypothetical protein
MVKKSFHNFLKQIQKTERRAIKQIEGEKAVELRKFDYQNSPPKMMAIDGSNRWIWNNPAINARIAIIRTAYVTYEFKKDLTPPIQILNQDSNDEAVLIAPDTPKIHTYDQDIQKLHNEIQRIIGRKNPVNETLSLLRTLAEFKMVAELASENHDSLIVMDGALTYVQIKEFEDTVRNILRDCKKNKNILVGVSKRNTTRWLGSELTDEAVMREMSRNDQKMVYMEIPVIPKSQQKFPSIGMTYLAKLHARPVKTFRVDIYNPLNENVDEIMSHLAYYSQVNTFPGYPFPLVDAHTIAALLRRVPDMYNHELVEAGIQLGFTEDDLLQYMITHENLENDPFHRYLDDTTR